MTSGPAGPAVRPPLYRDVRVLRGVGQVLFLVLIAALLFWLYRNLISNLRRQGLTTNYGFLSRPASFRIHGSSFIPTESVWSAIKVGVRNTALVSVVGITLASLLGLVVGVARLSTNWLVRRGASLYVETFRNVPVLVLILFMFKAVTLKLPPTSRAISGPGFVMSNGGLWIPWVNTVRDPRPFLMVCVLGLICAVGVAVWRTKLFDRTGKPHHRIRWFLVVFLAVLAIGFMVTGRPVRPDVPMREGRFVAGGLLMLDTYFALLAALVIYTASHIAEIVRGSIQSVAKGQTEAATALGLAPGQRLRLVVLPQALRVAIPPTANQYLNLTKNSSLALAVGYADVTAVVRIAIGNGNPAPQSITILMAVYLAFSLTIALITNLANRRYQLRTR